MSFSFSDQVPEEEVCRTGSQVKSLRIFLDFRSFLVNLKKRALCNGATQ